MPRSNPSLDAITGAGQMPPHFDHLDMTYRIRMRAFVGICMPPIFASMNSQLKMMPLRKKGIAPLMFHLDFASGATPIAFGRPLVNEHSLKFYRSVTDRDNQVATQGTERLMFVSRSLIKGKARTHAREALGFDDGTGATIEAGTAEIMHIITKPLGAPGERQVTAVPDELQVLREHRWDKPLPSVESLSVPPSDYERIDTGTWKERRDIWGIPNTDINQHVNVQEYVMGAENQFARLLFAARLPVDRHRISRARLLFRKPFFPGQVYAIRSQLYCRGALTQMHAGFHLVENDTPSLRPSSFVVFDGAVED